MERDIAEKLCVEYALGEACARFGTKRESLRMFPDYEGAANLVYEYDKDGKPSVLRISFRADRTRDMIASELDYVNYLAGRGVRVAKPLMSVGENFLETIETADAVFHAVSFEKAKGTRVPDNGYRYREGVPIRTYFRDWGSVLGAMHEASKDYCPAKGIIPRPDWFGLHEADLSALDALPERLQKARENIGALLGEIKALPKDEDSYGLIHGDFNDGNFTLDYSNGDMTVFDFDDSCQFWYVYEIASAWEGGIGRAMHMPLNGRKDFMDRYMEAVIEGYTEHCELPPGWVDQVPLFVRLIQAEEFLYFSRDIDELDEDDKGHVDYLIRCIDEGIPYMGFFDDIFSPDNPFCL